MKLRKKKGFTIIELVIVIAVIGILTAVLVPTFINLTAKANEAADDSLVKNLNTALKVEEQLLGNKKNETLQDAIDDLKDEGYLLENLISKSGKDLLWDQEKNEFTLNNDSELKGAKYWQIVDAIPTNQRFSYYAGQKFNTAVVNPQYGFDAGESDKIISVNYNRNGAIVGQKVNIRTNSYLTSLTVDAATDEVGHYGRAKNVDIIRVKNGTYDEYGNVLGNIKLAQGNVNIAKGGSASDVQIVPLVDANNVTVTPTASTVAVSIQSGADLNTVTNLTENVSIEATGTGASEVHSITPSASAIAYTQDGEITTLAALGSALQGSKKVTLLKDADLADTSVFGCDGSTRNSIRNPIMVTADFDLNGFTAYVLHFGFVVNKDNVEVSNGTISTAKTTYGNTKTYPVTSYDKTQIDRYGLVVQADDVVLSGLTVYGGVSLGGDASSYDPSYEHCTPVNLKGTNNAANTRIIGCNLVALNVATRKAIYAQSGSSGATLDDSKLSGSTGNTGGLFFLVGNLGDMGTVGDKNEITFNNVECNVNPVTETEYKINSVRQFQVTGSTTGTRYIVASTGYASSNVVIRYDGTNWILNGTLSYTIH